MPLLDLLIFEESRLNMGCWQCSLSQLQQKYNYTGGMDIIIIEYRSIMEISNSEQSLESRSLYSNSIQKFLKSESNPELYLLTLQRKIQNKFGSIIFLQDQVGDIIKELRDAVTNIQRLNRNLCDELISMHLTNYAKYFQQIRSLQAYFIEFTSSKLGYITEKFNHIRSKDSFKPPEKVYCSICTKQLKQVKIQQIYNSLNMGNALVDYKQIQCQYEQQERDTNQLGIVLNQIEQTKKQLQTLNNQKTIYSLEQFLKGTNNAVQLFFQDKTNFQKTQHNPEIIAILFKQFTQKFMEVSNKDIKPNVIKCAEDLADYLFRRRKDAIEYEDKQIQTCVPYPTKNMLKGSDPSKASKHRDRQQLKRTQEMLQQHRTRVEKLTQLNSVLQQQIKLLSVTQKMISSVKVLEQQRSAQTPTEEKKESQAKKSGSNSSQDIKKVQSEERPEIEALRMENVRRITMLRSSIRQTFTHTEFPRTSFQSVKSQMGIERNSANHKFNRSISNHKYQQQQELQYSDSSNSSRKDALMEKAKVQMIDCQVQAAPQVKSIDVQTIGTLKQPSHLRQSTATTTIERQSYNGSQINRLAKKQKQLLGRNSEWQRTGLRSTIRIKDKQEKAESCSEELLPSTEDIKAAAIKSELINMISKMNLSKLKQMSEVYLQPEHLRKNRPLVAKRDSASTKNFVNSKISEYIRSSHIRNLTNISLGAENNSYQQKETVKGKENKSAQKEDLFKEREQREQQSEESSGYQVPPPKGVYLLTNVNIFSMTQDKFGNQENKRLKGRQNMGRENIYSKGRINNSKPNVATMQRANTQNSRSNFQYQVSQLQRLHTQTVGEVKQLQDYFSKEDLIEYFRSLQAAYQYESNPHSKHKLNTRNKKKYQEIVMCAYKHVEQLKRSNNFLYHKIKAFIKFPYQSVMNQFDGPIIQSSISQNAFRNMLYCILNIHEQCPKPESRLYCSHFERLLERLKYVRQKAEINLPKLQESNQ